MTTPLTLTMEARAAPLRSLQRELADYELI